MDPLPGQANVEIQAGTEVPTRSSPPSLGSVTEPPDQHRLRAAGAENTNSQSTSQVACVPFSPKKEDMAELRIDALENYLKMLSEQLVTKLEVKQERIRPQAILEPPPAGIIGKEASPSMEEKIEMEGQDAHMLPTKSAAAIEAEMELDGYTWQESIWDVSFFLGMEDLQDLGSAFVGTLLLMNASMQFFLICIINEAFAYSEFTDETVEAMRRWRVFSGHSYDLVDKHTFEPLAKRVCDLDLSIVTSSGVVEILGLIGQYLPQEINYEDQQPELGHWLRSDRLGPCLCYMALGIWLLIVLRETRTIISALTAVWAIPTSHERTGHQVATAIGEIEEGTREVLSMSPSRKIWCTIVIGMQAVIAILLGVTGSLYILYTLSLQDLIMNCSALTIVLDVDELWFGALVPRSGKLLMSSLKPLPRVKPYTFRGLAWTAPTLLACLLVCGGLCWSTSASVIDILETTRNEICGGNLNFVAVSDKAGAVAAGSWAAPALDYESTYHWRAMRQLIDNEDGSLVEASIGSANASMTATVSGMAAAQLSLEETGARDVVAVMSLWNTRCDDLLPVTKQIQKHGAAMAYATHFMSILRDVIDDPNLVFDESTSCSIVADFCSQDNPKGVRARQICPSTCGCDDPSSGLVLYSRNGCPPECINKPAYKAALSSRTCTDLSTSSEYWAKYLRGLTDLQTSYPGTKTTDFAAARKRIRTQGCGMVKQPSGFVLAGTAWPDLCAVSAGFLKPFTYACPVACKCKNSPEQFLCPTSCQGTSGALAGNASTSTTR